MDSIQRRAHGFSVSLNAKVLSIFPFTEPEVMSHIFLFWNECFWISITAAADYQDKSRTPCKLGFKQ